MVPDVRLQSAGGSVLCVGYTVGFNLILLSFDQFPGFFKIGYGFVVATGAEVTMATVG